MTFGAARVCGGAGVRGAWNASGAGGSVGGAKVSGANIGGCAGVMRSSSASTMRRQRLFAPAGRLVWAQRYPERFNVRIMRRSSGETDSLAPGAGTDRTNSDATAMPDGKPDGDRPGRTGMSAY